MKRAAREKERERETEKESEKGREGGRPIEDRLSDLCQSYLTPFSRLGWSVRIKLHDDIKKKITIVIKDYKTT